MLDKTPLQVATAASLHSSIYKTLQQWMGVIVLGYKASMKRASMNVRGKQKLPIKYVSRGGGLHDIKEQADIGLESNVFMTIETENLH